jgi:hypothetical protein
VRHKDSPLVGAPGLKRADGRATHQGRIERMPYHKSTAEPGADGSWRPKQPALFAINEVLDCPVAVFGRLPRGFLTRIALPLLKAPRDEVLHVCSRWTCAPR